MTTYYIILTLNGNLVLKTEDKLKDTDEVEVEIYATDLTDAKKQFNAHKKELKQQGLI